MLVGVGHGLLARGTDEGRSSVQASGAGASWLGGLLCGTSGAEGSWLRVGGVFFFLFFYFSLWWRGWWTRRPDALLAPDVRTLAVPYKKAIKNVLLLYGMDC